jgi:hypothetical protein
LYCVWGAFLFSPATHENARVEPSASSIFQITAYNVVQGLHRYGGGRMLRGQHVLVIEDEPLIALDLEQI